MQKAKNTDEIGFNSCSCGQYLYSINEKRIKVAKSNYVSYYRATGELKIECCRCNKITVLKVQECMV